MTTSRDVTPWDFLTMTLWSVIFAIGLVPELAFHGLRGMAHVSTRNAFINSSGMITFALCVYIAMFAFRQCRAHGMSGIDAQGKAIHIALLALVAFIEIPGRSPIFGTQTLLGLMFQSSLQQDLSLKLVLWGVGLTKFGVWLYLYTLLIRFHVLGNRQVFCRVRTFFQHYDPALNIPEEKPEKKAESSSSIDSQ